MSRATAFLKVLMRAVLFRVQTAIKSNIIGSPATRTARLFAGAEAKMFLVFLNVWNANSALTFLPTLRIQRASGAQMLSDFLNQANSIKTYLNAQTATRLAAVFLGHNDRCSGTICEN